jgi:undecaprenyl-diphosphatase
MLFWEWITVFGDAQFWVGGGLTALILFFAVPKRHRKYIAWFIFLVLPAVSIGYGVGHILKLVFEIPRPCIGLSTCPTGFSFPSLHATVIFAASSVLIFHYKDKRLDVFFLILSVLVAVSRVMLGFHRIEDIIAGSIIGIVVGVLVQRVYENYHSEIKQMIKS